MKFTNKPADITKIKTDLLALSVAKGELASSLGKQIDRRVGGLLSRILKKEDFKGKSNEARIIDLPVGKINIGAVLLVGLGEEEKLDAELVRKIAAKLVRSGNRIRAKKVSIEEISFPKRKFSPETLGQAIGEGIVLGNYSFSLYKSDIKTVTKTVVEVEVLAGGAALQKGLKRGALFGEATNLARDLINTPASDMTPRRMAEEARKIGRLPRISAKVYDKPAIERMKMGCYLAVSRGSIEPPRFLHLTYKPVGRSRKTIAIIGKGVTFDSGGLSLKPAQSMETMKDDMSGGAAMLGIMKALSSLKLPITVHGISAVTENMPSGSAEKPGDIAYAMNGKSVEILNTDAEGRLTLADALGYAQKLKPDLMIDMATLTGACVVALGELCSGIMGNDQKLIDRIIAAGKAEGEKIWQLPLIEEYKEDLRSPIADLKNVGGRWGGTINGGLFLQEFVDPKVPWAHIDIAGPSWTEKELDYSTRGGTGHIVRTLLQFLMISSER
jgi:leucyl aminopeptidase